MAGFRAIMEDVYPDCRGVWRILLYELLDAIYVEYPEGVSTMPDRLSEAVINSLLQLDIASSNETG